MADIPETRPAPSTGQALARATIQRQYRRIKSHVTKNTIDALDEDMTLRAQVLQLMNELGDAQMKTDD
jgi:hypothetical protein